MKDAVKMIAVAAITQQLTKGKKMRQGPGLIGKLFFMFWVFAVCGIVVWCV